MKAPSHKELDLLNEEAVLEYLKKERPDIVIHTANVNTSRNQGTSAYESLNGNLQMFYNLEKRHDLYGKMYYFGSGAEYDMRRYAPCMKEDYFGRSIPQDPYGFSKYIMSRQAESTGNIYDLRLFGVYGVYEEWERRFISNNIVRSLKGLPMTLRKNAYFDYLFIGDLCKIMEWFLVNEPRHKHYNVCTSQPVDLLSLANLINEASGLGREILVKEEGWSLEYSGDNARLMEEMGGFLFADQKEAVQELLAYYEERIGEMDEGRLLL